ncbi:U6 snRNA-associated Sm-like protein LSm2 [Trifolium pratense]|uniref:U6 snRNA-associated Sm-like protein LSm2 n=1 Tax=Trifolium pratense TaxID=57577 RepID=A0A2K3MNZ8_TRIPR|nr:U6 snRNA-associated Sm-like protein LSm2 [Trifolium pratense]
MFFSYFKDLVGKEVTVELKNDLAIRGTLHSVDQYLNIKLENTRVVDQDKYPHMVQFHKSCWYCSIRAVGTVPQSNYNTCTVISTSFHNWLSIFTGKIKSSINPKFPSNPPLCSKIQFDATPNPTSNLQSTTQILQIQINNHDFTNPFPHLYMAVCDCAFAGALLKELLQLVSRRGGDDGGEVKDNTVK